MFYKAKKDNKLYTGFTKNLQLRFENHRKGKVESTKDRRPLKLIYLLRSLFNSRRCS